MPTTEEQHQKPSISETRINPAELSPPRLLPPSSPKTYLCKTHLQVWGSWNDVWQTRRSLSLGELAIIPATPQYISRAFGITLPVSPPVLSFLQHTSSEASGNVGHVLQEIDGGTQLF